jgi:hypothetical protein
MRRSYDNGFEFTGLIGMTAVMREFLTYPIYSYGDFQRLLQGICTVHEDRGSFYEKMNQLQNHHGAITDFRCGLTTRFPYGKYVCFFDEAIRSQVLRITMALGQNADGRGGGAANGDNEQAEAAPPIQTRARMDIANVVKKSAADLLRHLEDGVGVYTLSKFESTCGVIFREVTLEIVGDGEASPLTVTDPTRLGKTGLSSTGIGIRSQSVLPNAPARDKPPTHLRMGTFVGQIPNAVPDNPLRGFDLTSRQHRNALLDALSTLFPLALSTLPDDEEVRAIFRQALTRDFARDAILEIMLPLLQAGADSLVGSLTGMHSELTSFIARAENAGGRVNQIDQARFNAVSAQYMYFLDLVIRWDMDDNLYNLWSMGHTMDEFVRIVRAVILTNPEVFSDSLPEYFQQ